MNKLAWLRLVAFVVISLLLHRVALLLLFSSMWMVAGQPRIRTPWHYIGDEVKKPHQRGSCPSPHRLQQMNAAWCSTSCSAVQAEASRRQLRCRTSLTWWVQVEATRETMSARHATHNENKWVSPFCSSILQSTLMQHHFERQWENVSVLLHRFAKPRGILRNKIHRSAVEGSCRNRMVSLAVKEAQELYLLCWLPSHYSIKNGGWPQFFR